MAKPMIDKAEVEITVPQECASAESISAVAVVSEESNRLSDNIVGPSAHSESSVNHSSLCSSVVHFMKDLFDRYQDSLRAEPLKTKMLTSCCISLIGEIIGGCIKQQRFKALLASSRNHRNMITNMPPLIDVKRLAIFGFYGLAITGPVFHWWYGFLDKTVRKFNLVGENVSVITKVAFDRLIFTPAFLLFTLAYMQIMQTFNISKASAAVKNIYASAIYLNWKVWTPAQVINFKFVPLEYRVLFGNMVALWWNIMLSLKN
jgi:hypothetical protein